MKRLTQIRREIERKRAEMYNICQQYGYTSLKALKKSQELDQLLNIFQQEHIMKQSDVG
ncbi:aspartyl-phosphate phosphatase Spo0E family protein [Paenibacillus roseipurpureus]|uniref:Aspartyl-phosphate phosphatase Spo0E family protein n=1 Tax=Paenibacillus roseopurpureus TaxID=2918901 RepID=A0AA96RJ86_9BACL|nr:aspartyl-phosphate phosphatase Spo0E family protein [Paenibacillus sp. MBLB1832]WNR42891.1 aspartyl-phosphate phosphatase Spo0E family protein [Paenibacillus sp. MBLB1832]